VGFDRIRGIVHIDEHTAIFRRRERLWLTRWRCRNEQCERRIFAVSCSSRHHRLTGIAISPRKFMLCSRWRGSHVPAFPHVGGGAVAQHRQSDAEAFSNTENLFAEKVRCHIDRGEARSTTRSSLSDFDVAVMSTIRSRVHIADHVPRRAPLVLFGVYIKAWILSRSFGKLAQYSLWSVDVRSRRV
jgi:hypothetical protein